MSYRVRILPRAERDAQQIFNWIAERSPDGAVRWWDAFDTAVEKLAARPLGYGLAPEDELTDHKLQQFLFKTRRGRTYRGVFVVVDDEVRILRIRGPGQPPMEADELE
jgi:plasmid stabilization system protein ParE